MIFYRCVEYFVGQNSSISIHDLYEQTFEQWKLSDIADVGLACLPQTISQGGLVTLNGGFVLQMQFVIDIGIILSFLYTYFISTFNYVFEIHSRASLRSTPSIVQQEIGSNRNRIHRVKKTRIEKVILPNIMYYIFR